MKVDSHEQVKQSWSFRPEVVAIIIGSVAILGPVLSMVAPATSGEVHVEVFAPVWHLLIMGNLVFFTPFSQASIFLFPLVFFRLGFTHQMYQCYKANVTRARAIAVGILSELPILFLIALLWIPAIGTPYILDMPTLVPIPHLLLFGLILLYLTPPLEPRQWIEETPPTTW